MVWTWEQNMDEHRMAIIVLMAEGHHYVEGGRWMV